jgi:protein gp37
MAAETGVGWTDATANFWIGCTPCGPGCDGCYAAALARKRWQIIFEFGGERRRTKSAFDHPLRWQRLHERGATTMRLEGETIPVPRWVFALSLGDFFDNEVAPELRVEAWNVIRHTPALRWQIVTKRSVNVPKMLPEDWDGGHNYQHVGIIQTVVTQAEADRDVPRLLRIKREHGVKWVGLSIEPQLEFIDLSRHLDRQQPSPDWVISGGESRQLGHEPRLYDLEWGRALAFECRESGIPFFQKQMGDNAVDNGNVVRFPGKGADPEHWPAELRVQEMPRVYDEQIAA